MDGGEGNDLGAVWRWEWLASRASRKVRERVVVWIEFIVALLCLQERNEINV